MVNMHSVREYGWSVSNANVRRQQVASNRRQYWPTLFEFYTPPVEDLKKHLPQGEYEFQVDQLIWHF